MISSQTDIDAVAELDDSRGGWLMFLVFTAAVLIVSGSVALIALVGGWWILGVVFAIHVLMTAGVIATIAWVMAGRAAAGAQQAAVEALSREAPPPPPARAVAAV